MIADLTHPQRPIWWVICTAVVTASLVLLMQAQHGFYASDLGGDPDEPAHAVTSLMVRDYLTDGLGQNPLRFANDYYARFPKVALGHYPPMYYLVAGIWLLPFRNIAALGLLQALQIGLLAATTLWLLRRCLPMWASALVALAWSLTPFVLKLSLLVMSDLQLALLCLWSAMAWERFLETRKLAWSLAFGGLAAAAILTKASAWSLALLPGLSLLFTHRWSLVKSWRLWIACMPVVVLALPWQLWSSKITARGMTGMTPPQHFQAAVPFYAETLPRVLGWPIALVLVIAVLYHMCTIVRRKAMASDTAVLWSLLIATLVIVLAIPAGLTSRYLMPLFFPALFLAVVELQTFASWFAKRLQRSPTTMHDAVLVVVGSLTFLMLPVRYDKQVTGFASALNLILTQSANDREVRILAESDARGEGALIAAAAFHPINDSRPITMLRASKELASQDWMGRGYTLRANTRSDALRLLNERHVDWVLLDTSVPESSQTPDQRLLTEALGSANSGWHRHGDQPVVRALGNTGNLQLYQRHPTAPPMHLSQHDQPTPAAP